MTPEQEAKLLERIKGKLTAFFSFENLTPIDTKQKLFNIFHAIEQKEKIKTQLRKDFAKEIEERTARILANQNYIDELQLMDTQLDEFFENY